MFDITLALAGLFLLIFRMKGGKPLQPQLANHSSNQKDLSSPPRVSIIVPARNEAHQILKLLESLARLDPPAFEVIVVDDQSEDDTFQLSKDFAEDLHRRGLPLTVHVIRGLPKPPPDSIEGHGPKIPWNGKQWACHQGARLAQGDYFLFTDADTIHYPGSLGAAVAFAQKNQYGLISALPYHRCVALWDKLLGPFQVWLLAMTNPFGLPRQGRLYAIGQYLLFSKAAYETCGGHQAVRDQFVEDIPLAQRVLRIMPHGYGVYSESLLFEVQMYRSPLEFFRGWRRNFRAGFGMTSPILGVDAFLYIAAITGTGHLFRDMAASFISFMAIILLMWQQRRLGNFSILGPILFPVSLGMFCAVALCALFDKTLRRHQKWKGRSYLPSHQTL